MNTKKIIAMTLIFAFMSFFWVDVSEAKNFRSRKNFAVTGDGSNADASIVYVGGISTDTDHYRKITFPGLKMANPFSLRVFQQDEPQSGLGQESWSLADRYFITNGNLWFHYGNSQTIDGNTVYSDYSTGNHRYLSYYGGTKKKKRKNSAYKTYEFAISGTEGDADTTTEANSSDTTYYYRKVSIAELDMDNMADFRLFSRNDFPSGFDTESWMLETDDFFITDGNLYVAYGYKPAGSQFYPFGENTYRFFVYSDGKRKKSRLTKQYVKRYQFSVPGDQSAADGIMTYNFDGYISRAYFKKFALKGTKVSDYPNIQVLKKNNFSSGFADESWSHVNYTITNGYIWIDYGYQDTDPDGTTYDFEDTGSGDYLIFSYR